MAAPGLAVAEGLPADEEAGKGALVETKSISGDYVSDADDGQSEPSAEGAQAGEPESAGEESTGQPSPEPATPKVATTGEAGNGAPDEGASPEAGNKEPAEPGPEEPRSPLVAVIDTGCDASLCERAVSVIGGSPDDTSGHGISVVQMVLGQNPDARILSIKALDDEGRGSAEAICAALREAIDSGADIINMSFSTYAPERCPAIEELVEEALGRGIAVIAAAGNEGADAQRYCPAQIDGAITVGALGPDGEPLESSNAGAVVDAWIAASSTSYAAAIASGRLSISGRGAGWFESLLAYGDVSTIETVPAQSAEGMAGAFAAAFSHAVLSLTTHYAYDGNRSSSGTSVQTSPTVGDRNAQAIYLTISGGGTTGGITYRADPFGPDFLAWVSNGAQAGTTGEGRPLQRVQIKLTGNYAKAYSVQYRYYRINYDPGIEGYDYVRLGPDPGWTNWASDGGDPPGLGTVTSRWMTSLAVKLVARSYTHTVQVRYQNANGTYGGWSNARSGSYAYGSTVPAWSRAADGTYNAGSIAAYTAGFEATTKQVSITRKSYYLDVNGRLDGQANGGCASMGTFDFNVNGSNVANDVADYYQTSLAGSTWSITDVKAKPGYTYDGVAEGATSGTLGTANAQTARLAFHTNTYTVSFDGNGADGGTMDGQPMSCHSSSTLHTCAFERAGYSFTGWNTEPDGSGASFEDGEPVTNLTLQDKATVTLYAQWKQNLHLPATGSKTLTNSILSFFLYTVPAILVTKRTNRKPKRLSRKP